MARRTLSILLISLMSIAPVYADVSRASPVTPAVNIQHTQSHDLPVPDVVRLSGLEARARMSQVQAKHPAAFGKAMAALTRRGFHPTDLAFANLHSSHASTIARQGNAIQRVQDSWSGTEGEIDFWSWDDGYDGTWEGIIYAENYSTGVSVTFDVQLDIEVDGNYWTVFQDCAGVERNGQPYEVKNAPTGAQDSGIRLANLRVAREFMPVLLSSMNVNEASGKPYALVKARDYYWCALWGCLGAAVGCAFLGPAAPPCFFVACTAVLITCLAQLF